MELVYRTVLINIIKKPLKAFRVIYYYGLDKYKYLFLSIAGISYTINRQFFILADSRTHLLWPLAGAVGLGALLGWIGVALLSQLIYWSGTWIKGKGSSGDILNIASYAALPDILRIISALTCILLLRHFAYEDAQYPHVWGNIYYTIVRLKFYFGWAITLYYFVLLVIGISVVQDFSIGKSILNLLLAISIVMVPLGLLLICLRF